MLQTWEFCPSDYVGRFQEVLNVAYVSVAGHPGVTKTLHHS